MQKILIVEDDTNINNLLKEALEKDNYYCDQAFSGTEAKMLLNMNHYALVLLDLMLPGNEVLQEIRTSGNTPVIVLTAQDELDEKIRLLTNGADDYITKPFEIREVVARIQVQLRHRHGETQSNLLECRGLRLDKATFEVTVDGKPIPRITKQEFSILELLLKHPGQVFSKEEIFEYAWEEAYMGETKTLDVHISNIRKKLKTVTEEEYIETVWGISMAIVICLCINLMTVIYSAIQTGVQKPGFEHFNLVENTVSGKITMISTAPDAREILSVFLIAAVYGIAFTALSVFTFKRRDL